MATAISLDHSGLLSLTGQLRLDLAFPLPAGELQDEPVHTVSPEAEAPISKRRHFMQMCLSTDLASILRPKTYRALSPRPLHG